MFRTSTAVALARVALLLALVPACDSGGGGPTGPQPVPTGFGTPTGGTVTSALIGASGGTLASADNRLTLTVPPGALTADTTITITPISNLAHGGLGIAYDLQPSNVSFAQPVTLTFKPSVDDYDRIGFGGMGVVYQDDAGYWNWVVDRTVEVGAQTISVQTTHFSPWTGAQSVLLSPLSAEVNVNQTLAFTLRTCYAPDQVDTGALSALGFDCTDALAPLAPASEWSVQGSPGGNATVGTIAGTSSDATFQAPSAAPTPDVVSVTARVGTDTLVFASVRIVDQTPALAGNVDFTFDYLLVPGQTFTARAALELTVADDGPDETNYSATGTVSLLGPETFTFGDAICTLVNPDHDVNESQFLKVLKSPASVRWGFVDIWTYHCVGSTTTDLGVEMFYSTNSGTACSAFDDVPIADTQAPSGTDTSTCAGVGTVTATWDFQ